MIFVGIDTALVNAGLVIQKDKETVFAGKPYPKKQWDGSEDSFFLKHDRVRNTEAWIWEQVKPFIGAGIFIAQEDYLLTGHQSSYKTAELNALLKNRWYDNRIPYCLVHPKKTLKYVVKKRDVSKTEIIDYVKEKDLAVFRYIERADYSDIADAWVINQIGQMVYESMHHPDPPTYVKKHLTWEQRWKELLAVDESGIVTKPGLVKWSY